MILKYEEEIKKTFILIAGKYRFIRKPYTKEDVNIMQHVLEEYLYLGIMNLDSMIDDIIQSI